MIAAGLRDDPLTPAHSRNPSSCMSGFLEPMMPLTGDYIMLLAFTARAGLYSARTSRAGVAKEGHGQAG